MRRTLVLSSLTVLTLTPLSGAVAVSDAIPAGARVVQRPMFRSAVDLVRVDVLAVQNGRPLAGLTASDFEVFDNGVLQRVQTATTAGNVRVLLLLDVSGSLRWGTKMQALVRAGQSLVERLERDDEASLMTFSNRPLLQAATVRNPDEVKRALLASSTHPRGLTALWDALFVGLSYQARESGRSLVLLFTDGMDTASWCDEQKIREALKRAEAVVYAVIPLEPEIGPPEGRVLTGEERERLEAFNRARQSFVPKELKEIVEQSGGEVLRAERSEELASRFVSVLQEFRARYLLTYEPTGVGRDDGWHELRVRLKGRKGTTRARAGYYAASSKVSGQ